MSYIRLSWHLTAFECTLNCRLSYQLEFDRRLRLFLKVAFVVDLLLFYKNSPTPDSSHIDPPN